MLEFIFITTLVIIAAGLAFTISVSLHDNKREPPALDAEVRKRIALSRRNMDARPGNREG